jgi:hypothetical protein
MATVRKGIILDGETRVLVFGQDKFGGVSHYSPSRGMSVLIILRNLVGRLGII